MEYGIDPPPSEGRPAPGPISLIRGVRVRITKKMGSISYNLRLSAPYFRVRIFARLRRVLYASVSKSAQPNLAPTSYQVQI